MKTIKLNKLSKSILVASLLSVVALPAAAQKYRNNGYHNAYQQHVSYGYAKVVNVQPVYETYQVNNPVEHCYDQQAVSYTHLTLPTIYSV